VTAAPARPTRVTASTVVSATSTTLYHVIVGVAAATQTVKLHDCAAVGDASAGNLKATIDLATVNAYPFGPPGAYFAVGLVAVVSGGSPDISIVAG
jgi:hypothetical protein